MIDKHDIVLALIPIIFIKGGIEGILFSIPIEKTILLNSLLAFIVFGYALFVIPPVREDRSISD